MLILACGVFVAFAFALAFCSCIGFCKSRIAFALILIGTCIVAFVAFAFALAFCSCIGFCISRIAFALILVLAFVIFVAFAFALAFALSIGFASAFTVVFAWNLHSHLRWYLTFYLHWYLHPHSWQLHLMAFAFASPFTVAKGDGVIRLAF